MEQKTYCYRIDACGRSTEIEKLETMPCPSPKWHHWLKQPDGGHFTSTKAAGKTPTFDTWEQAHAELVRVSNSFTDSIEKS